MNQVSPRLQALAEREGYRQDERLDFRRVRVYIAEESLVKLNGGTRKVKCKTLTPANVTAETGIEARSFDETIEDMHRIQDEIVWGGGA